jgi:hypothetical protein
MDFSNILSHPDKDEVLSQLLTGIDPKDINQWLKLRYPEKDQKHLIISVKSLQDFSKSEYTKFYNQYTQEITTNIQQGGTLDKKVANSLLNNKTFKERLGEHALKEINVRERFLSIDLLIRDRIEQVFDKMQEDPGGWRGDYILMKWIEQYLSMVEKYDKSQNNRPDQLIQHNYTVSYINQQTAAMQEAFKEVLAEVDPDLALMIIDKMSQKLSKIKPPPEAAVVSNNVDDRLSEVQNLEETILKDKNKI